MKNILTQMDAWGEKLKEKEMRIPSDLLSGILFLLFSLFVKAVMPTQVAISEKDVVNGRAFPTLLVNIIMICCVVLIAREIIKLVKKQPLEYKTINLLTEVKALLLLGILLISYALCVITDLFVVGSIFCCVAFLLYFRCKKKSYYVITLTIAIVIWAVFRFALGVEF